MAHKIIDGKVVVDWTTGDPEGDRLTLLAAYRDFIKEIQAISHSGDFDLLLEGGWLIKRIFDKWNVDTENQIDEVPRIWITRP